MTRPIVLLTGFPGFLGSALLERLLARGDGPVACLVQPAYRDVARRRARRIERRLGVDADDRQIHLYEGDITRPDLGLGTNQAALEDVTACYHLAAVYDLGVERSLAEAVNVRGTEHVLAVADSLDVDRFHYVSTCYVSGRYDGVFTESHLREDQSFNNHYEATKYRAEVAVQDRIADGFPATVYRPAIVVGDSRTGETDKFDGPYNLLRLLFAQPRWLSATFTLSGSSGAELNVVPRDFVVDAIAALSDRTDTVGETYQLCDPSPLSVPQFVDALADATEHRTIRLPTTRRIATTALRALERASFDIEPETVAYLDHPTRYACPKTTRTLAEEGLEAPAFRSYVDQIVAYARDSLTTDGTQVN